ncbi:MAG: rhodanese-like domain-containing protein [bacterium]
MPSPSFRDFAPAELKAYLESHSPILLDVREPWEHQIAHLDNAVLLPMRQLPAALDEFKPDQEIVVICHHGIRSVHAARYLLSVGFNNIINLKGGIDRWARDLDPTMPVY